MHTVFQTLFFQHDLKLVALAAVICALASFAGISLVHHARKSGRKMQAIWLVVAAVSVGFGVWATHFVAMIAFSPQIPVGYDFSLTATSLLIAIVITGLGLWWATVGRGRYDTLLGGAITGIGIAAMHYLGMAAIRVGGAIVWDPALVAASLVLGIVLGGLALAIATHRTSMGWRLGGTAVLTLAICSMHFTGMGAAGFENCYSIVPANDSTRVALIMSIAGASILILLLALGGLALDLRDKRRSELETSRMRGLADAAVEGLIIVDGAMVVTVNSSFRAMAKLSDKAILARPLADFFTPMQVAQVFAQPNQPVEAELLRPDGERLAVEMILRRLDFAGKPHHAIAIRDLSQRKTAERRIRYLAHHDPLTGLANRTTFGQRLDGEIVLARRHQQSFAVLCIDLDRFKDVNDLFGHAVGDQVLQRVGAALDRVLGPGPLAARLGGDEFAVILPDIQSPERAGRIADQILSAFRAEIETSADAGAVDASIGIALFPGDADTAEILMLHADTALYRAKQGGRAAYRFFETGMGDEVRDRRALEHDLRLAIARAELRLVYQPQVDIQSGTVSGFEALLRWDHPQRGAVSPATFIPLAEESGMIMPIGAWVLRQACIEAARWTNPLTIAVNVSAVQIHSADFAETVADVLLETGLSPERLEVEMTETALVRDMARALSTLRQIKAMGVHIAVDDFGTGYSSLANLRAFPFDKIKVDQSFIRSVDTNEQSAAITRAVLGLGSGLGLPVVAEGVERIEELEFLRGEVCAQAQGYFLSRPGDIGSFNEVTSGRSLTLAA